MVRPPTQGIGQYDTIISESVSFHTRQILTILTKEKMYGTVCNIIPSITLKHCTENKQTCTALAKIKRPLKSLCMAAISFRCLWNSNTSSSLINNRGMTSSDLQKES